jgi:hypothetical protein
MKYLCKPIEDEYDRYQTCLVPLGLWGNMCFEKQEIREKGFWFQTLRDMCEDNMDLNIGDFFGVTI